MSKGRLLFRSFSLLLTAIVALSCLTISSAAASANKPTIEYTASFKSGYTLFTMECGDYEIRFTTDGSKPDSSSRLYKGRLRIKKNLLLRAAAFDENGNKVAAKKFRISVSNKTDTSTASLNEIDVKSEVLRLVNEARVAEGLNPLADSNERLNEAAQQRAVEISIKYGHIRPNGKSCLTVIDEYNVKSSNKYMIATAENIAYGFQSVEKLVAQWLKSSTHRANILNPNLAYLGVGYYESNGTTYWTQLFIS